MENEKETLTITLTGRRPVTIKRADWPFIAEAEHKEWNGQYEFQANRKWTYRLKARQHADGRTIVYAVYDYDTHWEGEQDQQIRRGELFTVEGATADEVGNTTPIIAAIQRVGHDMAEAGCEDGAEVWERLVHECIASLPAEVI